jgi:uncharacterized protein (UPF0332 family)
VKPEAALYLDKARQAVEEARAVAGIGLAEAAGRAAYLAAFHAAQALIFERDGRVPKTHRGFAEIGAAKFDGTLTRSTDQGAN